MCACDFNYLCARCAFGYTWRPDDLLILEIVPNPDEAAADRREAELSQPDFASPFKDAA